MEWKGENEHKKMQKWCKWYMSYQSYSQRLNMPMARGVNATMQCKMQNKLKDDRIKLRWRKFSGRDPKTLEAFGENVINNLLMSSGVGTLIGALLLSFTYPNPFRKVIQLKLVYIRINNWQN